MRNGVDENPFNLLAKNPSFANDDDVDERERILCVSD